MAKREVWERRVRRWRRSSLTAAEFAADEGVKRQTLLWWSSKLQREARAAEATATAFVEVTAVAESMPIEVELPNGRVVRVPAAFEDDDLARVLSVAGRS